MLDDRYYRYFNVNAYEDAAAPSGLKIQGKAIAFEKPTLITGIDKRGQKRQFYEVIDKHSLDKCDMKDVPLRSEHDTKTIYARTRNNSLKLAIKPDGLYITAYLLDNEKSKTLYDEIQTGLIPQMSFSFPLDSVAKIDGTYNGLPLRRVMEIPKLLDVSVCAYAAYGDETFVNARSFDWIINKSKKDLKVDRNMYAMKLKITEAVQETRALLKGDIYK